MEPETTSFYIIAGLVKSDSTIEFIDQDITNMPMHKRSNLGIKYLPKNHLFFKILLFMKIFLD